MRAYAEVCRALSRARVPYVIIGAFGVGLYAKEAGTLITTADCDLLLPTTPGVLARAIRALRRGGYAIEAGGEPLVDEDKSVLAAIVRARASVQARRRGTIIDLALQAAGCRFESLLKRSRRFSLKGVIVRVAALEDILRSKERAGRPKDLLFLETYRDALKQLLERKPLR